MVRPYALPISFQQCPRKFMRSKYQSLRKLCNYINNVIHIQKGQDKHEWENKAYSSLFFFRVNLAPKIRFLLQNETGKLGYKHHVYINEQKMMFSYLLQKYVKGNFLPPSLP